MVRPLFPTGKLEPHEKHDFLLYADRGKIGIEVTELCREEPRAEGGRLPKVPEKAKAIYDGRPGISPVDVNVWFWRAETVGFAELRDSLADFVYANRGNVGNGYYKNLPPGFSHIGIWEPQSPDGFGKQEGRSTRLSREEIFLRTASQRKTRALRNTGFRRGKSGSSLLMTSSWDRERYIHGWSISQPGSFLLILTRSSREPGGTGEVIEIQRVAGP